MLLSRKEVRGWNRGERPGESNTPLDPPWVEGAVPSGKSAASAPRGNGTSFFFFGLGVLSLSENSVLLVPEGPLRP